MQSCPFFTRELIAGVYTDTNLNKHMLYQRPWSWSQAKSPPPTTRQRRLTVVAAAWELKETFCASVPLIFSLNSGVKVRKLLYVILRKKLPNFLFFYLYPDSLHVCHLLGGEVVQYSAAYPIHRAINMISVSVCLLLAVAILHLSIL
jgi:hypothetical protein